MDEVFDYVIRSDEHQFIVYGRRTWKGKSEKAGQDYYRPLGYFRYLENAAKFVIDQDLRRKADMMPVIEAIEQAKQECLRVLNEMVSKKVLVNHV